MCIFIKVRRYHDSPGPSLQRMNGPENTRKLKIKQSINEA